MFAFQALQAKMLFIGGIMFAFFIVFVSLTYLFTEKIKGEARMINVAGRERMLALSMSYRVMHMLNLPASPEKEKLGKGLDRVMSEYEETLFGLRYGSAARGLKSIAGDKESLAELNTLINLWQKKQKPLLLDMVKLPPERKNEACSLCHSVIRANLGRIEALGTTLEKHQSGEIKLFGSMRLYALAFFLSVTVFIIFYAKRIIINPLLEIANMAKEVKSGNFNGRLKINGDDEIARLAMGFNNMTESLAAAFAEKSIFIERLEEKVRERTRDFELTNLELQATNEELLARRHDAETAMEQVRQSEEKLRLLLDSTAEAIYGTDLNGNCTFCNTACLSMLGYQHEDDLTGKNMHSRIHHTYQDGTAFPVEKCRIYQAFRLGEGTHVDDEVLWRADGTSFPVEYWSYPQYRNGVIIGAVVTFVDITERRQAQEKLLKLSRAVENSPAIVVITDRNGCIEYVNPKFTGVTGYLPEEAIGQNPRILNSGKQPKEFYKELWETILSGNEWKGEFCNKKKNGELHWEHASISPIRDEDGTITHFVAIKEDVTEQKRIAAELLQTRDAAQAANRAKSEFLANMSHELRTPLNSIIGFSEVLQDEFSGPLNEQQKDYLNDISSSGKHLLSLINDILDLSKVEAGKMELEPGIVPLKEVLGHSISMLKEKAMKGGVNLKLDVAPEADIEITADKRKLKQIMFNLLSNAVKFTPEGGRVTVKARLLPDVVEISVTDTGIGIKSGDMPRLFQEFSQLESAYDKKYEGTGLGLALTKRLVELHGGAIGVESEYGKGSTFVFAIPTKQLEGK
jgi:PAS domain S-box-containing protein